MSNVHTPPAPGKRRRPKLPAETCADCGKPINRRAIANVFEERVVCTACWRKLEAARVAALPPPFYPATDNQKRYAAELGIPFAPGISSSEISDLISAKVNAPAPPALQAEARALGITTADRIPGRELPRVMEERRQAIRWVYSVCRHMLGAKWLLRRDSGLPLAPVLWIAADLATREECFDEISELDEGSPDLEFDRACDRRGLGDRDGNDPDDWYFFQHGGANSRGWIYKHTRSLIEERLGPYLATRERGR